MPLLLGDSTDIPFTDVNPFEGHKDKSSEMAIMATAGVLAKKKRRNISKSIREFFALKVWQELLKSYNHDGGPRITSPSPLCVDEEGVLYMSLLPGITGSSVVSGNYPTPIPRRNMRTNRFSFATHLGRLLRIKEIEGLAHNDFQLRHLLFSGHKGALGVIDVENTTLSRIAVPVEHTKILEQTSSICPPRNAPDFRNAFEDGYYSPIDAHSIIDDVVAQIHKALGHNVNLIKDVRSR